MQIRLKSNHAIQETVQYKSQSPAGAGYYRAFSRLCDQQGRWEFFSEEHWELVPEKQWRTVTAECDVVGDGQSIFSAKHAGNLLAQIMGREYRFRKVALDEFKTMVGPHSPICERYDVLIVEKLEEAS